ncbi:ABC transporter permease [Cohnella sp. GCM10012308]|uniref:ABC transporter permease n=1 Tax=Cohnella sp. GCM10012308 TaxID=3317329 RepID=UPI00360E09FB
MLLPGVILVFIFSYIPMAGMTIAFQKFRPARGLFGNQEWIGLGNFTYLLDMPDFKQVIGNTLIIALAKIVLGIAAALIVALLLNELKALKFKKFVQTSIYFPHFISWVILSGILIEVLSPESGIVNAVIKSFGGSSIFFLADNRWFPFVLILSDVWKNFGYSTIVFLAAITSINQELYEVAKLDGAGRFKQMLHITLPGMMPIIVLVSLLSIGGVLDAGFEQVFNLYNPAVYASGDIIDTFVYRTGLLEAQFGVATAVGVFKSFVSLFLISTSYLLAYKLINYRIF